MTITDIHLALPAWIAEETRRDRVFDDDESRVAFAIGLARRNVRERTGGPFGAAVFDGDGRLVSAGVNVVLPQTCSVAHAEIMAFASAQKALGLARLNGDGGRYVVATSSQPCAMCYGASIWAGIDELLISARGEDVLSLSAFDEGPLPADWIGELAARGIAVKRDILRNEGRDVFRLFAEAGGATY